MVPNAPTANDVACHRITLAFVHIIINTSKLFSWFLGILFFCCLFGLRSIGGYDIGNVLSVDACLTL